MNELENTSTFHSFMKAKDVDAYIAAAPKEVQNKLSEIRAAIIEVTPNQQGKH